MDVGLTPFPSLSWVFSHLPFKGISKFAFPKLQDINLVPLNSLLCKSVSIKESNYIHKCLKTVYYAKC